MHFLLKTLQLVEYKQSGRDKRKGLEANLFEIWILELYIIRVREVADSEAEEKERNSSVLRLWFWTQMMHML